MKKKYITYAVLNMVEYNATITVNRKPYKINFTGGNSSALATRPATFSTSSFILQQAIENSSDFKRGLIINWDETELDGEIVFEKAEPKVEVKCEVPTTEEVKIEAETAVENAPAREESNVMEFSCNDDAKDYLEQKFGVQRTKMTTRANIEAIGKANGVVIKFSK